MQRSTVVVRAANTLKTLMLINELSGIVIQLLYDVYSIPDRANDIITTEQCNLIGLDVTAFAAVSFLLLLILLLLYPTSAVTTVTTRYPWRTCDPQTSDPENVICGCASRTDCTFLRPVYVRSKRRVVQV